MVFDLVDAEQFANASTGGGNGDVDGRRVRRRVNLVFVRYPLRVRASTANNLLRWVRDYVQVKADGKITADLADRALTMLEIDRDGFDQWDKRIIETLIHKFNGGPVGLNSLAVAIGEEAGTLEEVNEPYLIMEGYIKRTPQGRVATANAYKKLGLTPPTGMQQELL